MSKEAEQQRCKPQIWPKRSESHTLMYVQGYMKKELFINFFSLQLLQAILFLQYLQFSKEGRAGGGKKIFICTAQTHSSETD